MSKQYFENNEELGHDYREISFGFKGHKIVLLTDQGVFSKSQVDYGTIALLKCLPELTNRVLDVGCGYGPIGISLATCYPKTTFDLIDVNNRAIELSTNNASHLANVNVFLSTAYASVTEKYQYIITNPPIRAGKQVVLEILLEAKEHLVIGGEVWAVVQIKQGALSLIKEMQNRYSSVEQVKNDRGYIIIRAVY